MSAMADAVKSAFQREFITTSGRLAYDDQTSYALAILHGLIPEQFLEAARGYFKATIARADGRLGTGFIGTPALLPALVKMGEVQLAADIFLQEEVPGWLYQVKMGATTIWERWDAIQPDGTIYNPEMNSYNHYSYGSVCQWLFESVAGFQPDPETPGFATIIFRPTIIPELSPVSAWHESARGRIEAGWSVQGRQVRYDIEVPAESRGVLRLPDDYRRPTVDGSPFAGEYLGPGKHRITFSMASDHPRCSARLGACRRGRVTCHRQPTPPSSHQMDGPAFRAERDSRWAPTELSRAIRVGVTTKCSASVRPPMRSRSNCVAFRPSSRPD